MKRDLFGEPVENIMYVTGENLSDALSEAALHVRDSEQDPLRYFRIVQQWNEDDGYELLIYEH